jgi:starch synthase
MLAPARFEPCGLTPIYAMRYGTVPVVRPVGGLVDSVQAAGSGTSCGATATGFSFAGDRADDLVSCLAEVISQRRNPDLWRGLQRRGMQRDYSWRTPARAYGALYQGMLGSVTSLEPTWRTDAEPVHRAVRSRRAGASARSQTRMVRRAATGTM